MLQKFIYHQEIKSKSLYGVSGEYHKDMQKQTYQFTKPNMRLQPCECTFTPLPCRPAPTHGHKNYSHSWSPPLPGKSHCTIPAGFISLTLCKVLPEQSSHLLHCGSCPTLTVPSCPRPQHTPPPQTGATVPVHSTPSPVDPSALPIFTLSENFHLQFIFFFSGLRSAHPCPG